ncbi:MAG: hypothetical protein N2Z65_03135 [Clostridiales bacterium]|nr:hypothetical protein [Clostridiales bacterium]
MTLYTQIAYDDLCGYKYPEPQFRMENGILIEYRGDAYGNLKRNRIITTDLKAYLKYTL